MQCQNTAHISLVWLLNELHTPRPIIMMHFYMLASIKIPNDSINKVITTYSRQELPCSPWEEGNTIPCNSLIRSLFNIILFITISTSSSKLLKKKIIHNLMNLTTFVHISLMSKLTKLHQTGHQHKSRSTTMLLWYIY